MVGVQSLIYYVSGLPVIDPKLDAFTQRAHFKPTYGRAKTPRTFLKYPESSELIRALNSFFESKIEIQRIKHGKNQTFETLINEEALLLAMYIRDELPAWYPRTPRITNSLELACVR
jgi:hypothetical protein